MNKKLYEWEEIKNTLINEVCGRPIENVHHIIHGIKVELSQLGRKDLITRINSEFKILRHKVVDDLIRTYGVKIKLTDIIGHTAPKKLNQEGQIQYRAQSLRSFLDCSLITAVAKDQILYQGITYENSGTISLIDFAVDGIIIELEKFCVFNGIPKKKADKYKAKEILKEMGINRPSNTDFHHQIAPDGRSLMVLVPNELHTIYPHLGYIRYEYIGTK